MTLRQRLTGLVSLALFQALSAVPVAAQEPVETVFQAPEWVRARGDGSFSFQTFLVAGDDVYGWLGYCWFGRENIDDMYCVDTFCYDMPYIEPGAVYGFTVSSRLTDPSLPGLVESDNVFCSGQGGSGWTTVWPPLVADEPVTWGALKARYR